MIGRSALLGLVLFASLPGCARPKYERVVAGGPGAFQVEKFSDCKTRFAQSNYCVVWNWEKAPTESEAGVLVFKVLRQNAMDDSMIAVELEADPAVVLWMPSMGHGSSPTTVSKVDTGSYRVSNVFFVMPGEWEIKFQIKEGKTVADEAVVALTI